MEQGFDCLRCPMCGGELVYSEGTHDLCCSNNPYEREGSGAEYGAVEEDGGTGAAMHESAAEYSPGGADAVRRERYMYKVSPAGDDAAIHSARPAEGRNGHKARESRAEVEAPAAADTGNRPVTPVKRHTCAFAVSFTESGRYGTLWSVRVVHGGTNYFSLMRLMQKIEKRQRAGAPLARNVPNLPRKKERTAASKLAFRYGVEVEDLYSIRYISETPERLAGFYGISVRDIRSIKKAEIEG